MAQRQRKTWNEFRATGLLVFVNTFLHIFGWSIVVEVDTDTKEVVDCYPCRVTYRGFNSDDNDEAYQKLTKYMADNSKELLKDIGNEK